MSDNVNKPAHYTQGSIECIDAIAEVVKELKGMEAVNTANIIKYMWRWKHKNGIEDVKKAAWYCVDLVKRLEKEKV
jgi:Protein of unknwon function (DUF3310)